MQISIKDNLYDRDYNIELMKRYYFILLLTFFISCKSRTSRLYGVWEVKEKFNNEADEYGTEGLVETKLDLKTQGIYESSITFNVIVRIKYSTQKVILPKYQLRSTGHWEYKSRELHLDRQSDNLHQEIDGYTEKLKLSPRTKVILDKFFNDFKNEILTNKKSIFQIVKITEDEFIILTKTKRELSLRKMQKTD